MKRGEFREEAIRRGLRREVADEMARQLFFSQTPPDDSEGQIILAGISHRREKVLVRLFSHDANGGEVSAPLTLPIALTETSQHFPPRFGEFLLCLFVRADRHKDRLGDMQEQFTTLWVPRFGVQMARCIYVAQVVRTVARVAAVGALMAMADKIWHAPSR